MANRPVGYGYTAETTKKVKLRFKKFKKQPPEVFCKKVLLKTSQNSQENTCARVSFLINLKASTLLKKRPWHRYFPMNFAKFSRTPFVKEHFWWLLLKHNLQYRSLQFFWVKPLSANPAK